MLGAIVLLHRWLGVAFCLLFAMWFATGIVMHFVPFPALADAERFAGLAPVDLGAATITVAAAVQTSGVEDATRVRLVQRVDGPVFIAESQSLLRAVYAADGRRADVAAPETALAIARAHAGARSMSAAQARVVAFTNHDQWTVPNGFDRHRPLFRVALGDEQGTELYVSSVTGQVVLDTTRRERGWNYAGSVLHWIYPTLLRSNWGLWDRVVWTLSLGALAAAVLGAVLGLVRVRRRDGRLVSPYRGWHALHHVLGLAATLFVLSWIFSGWLSMDHGRLFSRGELTPAEAAVVNASPDWRAAPSLAQQPIARAAREVEWFAFNGEVHRRERVGLERQLLRAAAPGGADAGGGALNANDIRRLMIRLAAGCSDPTVLAADDPYPGRSTVPGAPVFRTRCGELWFDVDGADGRVLQRWDASRRAYRWLYSALHTLDVPVMLASPRLNDVVIVGLCALGVVFSITGIVIAWRRLRAFRSI